MGASLNFNDKHVTEGKCALSIDATLTFNDQDATESKCVIVSWCPTNFQ